MINQDLMQTVSKERLTPGVERLRQEDGQFSKWYFLSFWKTKKVTKLTKGGNKEQTKKYS
jgi:hypothetical protein